MKTTKNGPGIADEDVPNPSTAPDHVISKPWKESKVARSWMIDQESDPLFNVSRPCTHSPHLTLLNFTFRILSGTSRNTPCHDCLLTKTTNPPEKIFLRPISTRVAKSLSTKRYASTTQHTTSRGVQTSSTSARGLILWSLLLKTITLIPIDTADSSTFSPSLSTTKARSRSLADPEDRKFKSSGYAGSNGTLTIRMGSLTFASHGCSSLNRAAQPTGIALSRHLTSYALLI